MRKLFVALMAVLVLASCGGDKKQAAGSVKNQNITETSAVTPSDVIMMTAELMDNAVVNLEKAATADDVIDAACQKATINFYGAVMSKATLMENLTPEQEARLQGILETEI